MVMTRAMKTAEEERKRGRENELMVSVKRMRPEVLSWESVYLEDQFRHYKSQEKEIKILNGSSRAILVDWLIEVHFTFQLEEATLYLTIALLDKYLEKEKPKKEKLQLVGITMLFIAAKYEEVHPPDLQDAVYVTNETYSEAEVLETEIKILKVLNWRLSVPTAHAWILRLVTNKKMKCLAHYYAQNALLDPALCYKPSLLAALAVFHALSDNGQPWTANYQQLSGYSEAQLNELQIDSFSTHDLKAIKAKFSHASYYHVYPISSFNTQITEKSITSTPLLKQRPTTPVVVTATDDSDTENFFSYDGCYR